MTPDPFWWLRLILIALIMLVSSLFGVEPSFDPRTASLGDLIGVLFDTTEEGIEESGGIETLADYDTDEDDELGEITDAPITDLPPTDDENDNAPGGGVVGGGVSAGPDPSGTTPPPATNTPPPTSTSVPPTPTDEPATATAIATESPTSTPMEVPTETPGPTETAEPTSTATPDPAALRLDDPVLRWLPELRAAARATGISEAVLAALVRVESNGDPNLIAADGGRGLAGVPADLLQSQGVPAGAWHDPATNLLAAGQWIAGLHASSGSLEAALQAAWGPSCDAIGQCAGLFTYVVLAWQGVYAPLVANPEATGIPALPSDWTPPAIAPYQENSPRPISLPPGVPAPTPTATPEPTPTETPLPTETPEPTATETPTETPTVTPEPTATSTAEGASASPPT